MVILQAYTELVTRILIYYGVSVLMRNQQVLFQLIICYSCQAYRSSTFARKKMSIELDNQQLGWKVETKSWKIWWKITLMYMPVAFERQCWLGPSKCNKMELRVSLMLRVVQCRTEKWKNWSVALNNSIDNGLRPTAYGPASNATTWLQRKNYTATLTAFGYGDMYESKGRFDLVVARRS